MGKRPRILYIGNKLSESGTTPTSIDTLGRMLQQEGMHIKYASSFNNIMLRFMHMMLSVVRYSRYDFILIDTYSTKAFYFAWASARMARIFGLRYIPILHGGNLPQRFTDSPSMCRQVFSKSYTNVVVSPYLQATIQKYSYRHVLIPNSIDINNYAFSQRGPGSLRLLWVRAFHRTYNPDMALRMLQELCQKYPSASLTMVGPEKDGSMQRCMELAMKLGISKNVTFTGKLEKKEWIALAANHDIFINTSDFDNLPVSIIEAMALGLPVVSTDPGGIPFFITNDKDGLLVKCNDHSAMCNAISGLLDDASKSWALAQQARLKAEGFDWDRIRHSWKALLSNELV